jgi:uncharacterized membrane protein
MNEADEQAEVRALRNRIDALDLELGQLSARLVKLETRHLAVGTDASLADTLGPRFADTQEPLKDLAGDWPPATGVPAKPEPTGVPATPEPAFARAVKPPFSWEAFIGGQGALWIGSAAVFIALACGLAYAWSNIPPGVRVSAGFLLSAAFLVGSAYSRKKSQGWFADGIAGAGLALAYLDAWSGFSSFQLYGADVEFLLMGITTVVGAVLAVRHDAIAIGVLATLGGFITPYMAADSTGAPALLFAYVFILDLLLLAVSFYKRWHPLGWLGLVGTVILAGGTAWHPAFPPGKGYSADYAVPVAAWFTAYYLEFSAAAVAFGLRQREQSTQHDVLLLIATGTLYGAGTYALLQETLGHSQAAFPVGLALICGAIAILIRRLAPENTPLRAAAIGLGIFFITLAAPAQFDAHWLAVAWVAEGALLEGLGIRLNGPMLRRAGYIVGAAAAVVASSVMITESSLGGWPVLNTRALPLLCSLLASFFLLGWGRNAAATDTPTAPQAHALWGVLATVWLVFAEIHDTLTAHSHWATAVGVGQEGVGPLSAILASAFLVGMAVLLDRISPYWGGRVTRMASLVLTFLAPIALVVASCFVTTLPGTHVMGLVTAWTLGVVIGIWFLRRSSEDSPADHKNRETLPGLAALTGIWVTSQAVSTYKNYIASPESTASSLTLTAAWLSWGLILMGIGLKSGRAELRRIALGLLTLTAFKVLIVDLGNLPTGERIFASGGLGIVLIMTSWLYGRLGKKTQAPEEPST